MHGIQLIVFVKNSVTWIWAVIYNQCYKCCLP